MQAEGYGSLTVLTYMWYYWKSGLACSQRGVCDVTLECTTFIEPGHPSCAESGALDQQPSEVTGS